MLCPQHGIEFILKPAGVSKRTGHPYSAFYACSEYGCKERPPRQQNYAPRPSYSPTQPSTPARNFDREAYEKCCSIWAAAEIGAGHSKEAVENLNSGAYWQLFQAIRADGQKRFATGMEKARLTLGRQDEPPIGAYENDPEAQ